MSDVYHIESCLIKSVHPHILRTLLYDDEQIENRLHLLVDVEIVFEKEYGYDLFIQCDVETHTVWYEVGELGLLLECSW